MYFFLSSWPFDHELLKININNENIKTVKLIVQPSITGLRSVGQVDSLFEYLKEQLQPNQKLEG